MQAAAPSHASSKEWSLAQRSQSHHRSPNEAIIPRAFSVASEHYTPPYMPCLRTTANVCAQGMYGLFVPDMDCARHDGHENASAIDDHSYMYVHNSYHRHDYGDGYDYKHYCGANVHHLDYSHH